MPSLNVSTMALPVIQAAAAAASFSDSACKDIDDCRKLRDIVWSCVVTIFACIWVSVHPNCPPTDRTNWQATKRRIKVSAIALLTPEVIAAWALQQFMHARWLRNRANKPSGEHKDFPKLTMSHAFLIIMGGCISSKAAQRPVYTSELWEKDEESDTLIALRAIRECEISDKSKSDVLARTLTFLQTLWFIIQCIARAAQKLPSTKLEVVTLAYAVLSGFGYAMWWNKPMDLRVPIVLEVPASIASNKADSENSPRNRSGLKRFAFFRMFRVTTLRYLQHHYTRLLWTSGMPGHDLEGDLSSFLVISALGMLFGGIHIIPWNFTFPTHNEQLLWRICAIIITSVPTAILIESAVALMLNVPILVTGIMVVISILLYIPARVILLILPFLTLRSLEAAAYQSISWVNLLPHRLLASLTLVDTLSSRCTRMKIFPGPLI